ncbi:MAG: DNA glycosylase [Sulfobacillus benefaciens]|uniref:DNA glycosylase n=1 Tax=Sulfobacillus benefaciens TaxID=453960 RepID=A0A2T2WSR8_9FIRM|nr:MAG: DNA glycosylase [Sulfobacillus benefaciens]
MPEVKDVLAPNLNVLFVGYNPGVKSGMMGHHFAGPGNLFWSLLVDSGLTGHRLRPEQDQELPVWHLGITNIVERVTPGSEDLFLAELKAGALQLQKKIRHWEPKIVAFLGKDIYRNFAGLPRSTMIPWGLQMQRVTTPLYFVAPNPSRRSTLPYEVRLRYFREIKNLADWGVEPYPKSSPE